MRQAQVGLWELKISSGQTKGSHAVATVYRQKTDDTDEKRWAKIRKTQCSKNEMRKEGDKIVPPESVCKLENSAAKTRAVFTGSFDSTTIADIKSTYEPPLRGMKEASSVIEAKWLVPAKPDRNPAIS